MIYPNNLKNREFSEAESYRFDFKKSDPFFDIGADFSGSKMGTSVKEKADSSGYLGIKDPEKKFVYKLVIAYDGTSFFGWQVQTQDVSIQGSIEKALGTITKETVRVIGSGRTDTGVHALGQVAHTKLSHFIDPKKLQNSLNGLLPPTIRIRSVEQVHHSFHAQLSAKTKEYHYHICLDEIVLPFERLYVWHYRKRLNLSTLKEAAALFVGTHDFAAFANSPGKTDKKISTIRTIIRLDVFETKTGLRLEFEGTGFLYKMVRNITGMIVAVASGRKTLADIKTTLLSKDRRKAERAAPPEGLFLMEVKYMSKQEEQEEYQ